MGQVVIIAVGQTYLDFQSRQVTVLSVQPEGVLVSRASDDDFAAPELWMVDGGVLAATLAAQNVVGPYLAVGSIRSHAAAVQSERAVVII